MWRRWRSNDTYSSRPDLCGAGALLYWQSGCLVQHTQPAGKTWRKENKMKAKIFWNNVSVFIRDFSVAFTMTLLGALLGAWIEKTIRGKHND
jgi:hypothetical protein